MGAAKTFFEQIPIETVKRIAIEFSGQNVIGSDGGHTEMPGEVRSPHESWREVAQKVIQEQDPKKMIELIEQLIAGLDEEQLCKRTTHKRNAEIVQTEARLDQMSTTVTKLPVTPTDVECPFCRAGVGKPCITSGGKDLHNDSLGAVLVHVARIKRAAEANTERSRQTRG